VKESICLYAPVKKQSPREGIASAVICELEASEGDPVYLMIRYFDLHRTEIEGDHLYLTMQEAKADALAEFGIESMSWNPLSVQESIRIFNTIHWGNDSSYS
jgi:hypothetical protein